MRNAILEFDENRICVLGGAGYVGLITGVGFATLGRAVVCADINAGRVEKLTRGEPPIHEKNLPELLKESLEARRISFTTDIGAAIKAAGVVIVAVGTPALDSGASDVSQAIQTVEQIANNLNSSKLIIIKSTLPLGIRDEFDKTLARRLRDNQRVEIVFNPEFLREGSGIHDFFNCERIIVGGASDAAFKRMKALYKPLLAGEYASAFAPPPPSRKIEYIETDPATAQLIKYASNAYLATRLSFVNEIAGLSERLGCDTKLALEAVGMDARIGASYLQPGPGFGGPCLEKDISALIKLAEYDRYNPIMLKSALERNRLRLNDVLSDLRALTGKLFAEMTVCVFGVAFKAETNDARSALSIKLIERLVNWGASVNATDPLVSESKFNELTTQSERQFYKSPYDAAENADVIVVMNADRAYARLDYERIAKSMQTPIIYDTRYYLNRAEIEAAGLKYFVIGQRF